MTPTWRPDPTPDPNPGPYRHGRFDVAFLNEVCPMDGGHGAFLSQAALWLTPFAARRLLKATRGCFVPAPISSHVNPNSVLAIRNARANLDIDKYTRAECFKSLRCLSAPAVRSPRRYRQGRVEGSFGCAGSSDCTRLAVKPNRITLNLSNVPWPSSYLAQP